MVSRREHRATLPDEFGIHRPDGVVVTKDSTGTRVHDFRNVPRWPETKAQVCNDGPAPQ